MADNTIQVNIEVDDKGSVKIKQFGKTVKDAGNEAETGFRKAGKSLGDFDSQAERTIGTMGRLIAAIAASVAVKKLYDISQASIKLASDLEEVQSKFNVVFAGQTAQAEAWASNLSKNYNLTTTASKQYLASVQDLLVPMGMASEQAGVMSNEIVKLSADLGSFNNLETAQVMDDIQSALVGNYETMKKYGVVLNAATVEQRAMSLGLAETKNGLDAADKAQAAYAIMVEASSAAIGDVARTMDGYANQARLAKKNTEDMQTTFGQGLLPAVNDVTTGFNEWVAANDELLKQDLEAWGRRTGAAIKAVSEAVGFLGTSYLGWSAIIARVQGDAVELERIIARINNQDFTLADQLRVLNDEQARLESTLKSVEAGSTEYALLSSELQDTRRQIIETSIAMEEQALSTDIAAEATRNAATVSGTAAVEVQKLGEQVDKAAIAWHNYQVATTNADSWLSRDRGMVEANERAQEMIDTLSDLDALVSDDAFFDIAATIEAETKDATETSKALWDQFATDTGSIIENFVGDTLRGEFDSIGDMFEGLLDSMLSMLINFIAKAAAEDLINTIFKTGNGGSNLSLMNLFSSDSSSGRSSGIGIEAGTGLAAESGMLGRLGGAVGVAGGAYSMYSGAQDVGDGNYGTGAIKIGVGGYTAYKGAVTLGAIEEGAATKLGAAIGDKFSSYFAAESATTTATTATTSGASVPAGWYGGTGGIEAGTGATAGSAGMLAGGVYAAAALIAMKVAKGFIDGPSTKIDTLLNRDLQGRGMSAGALFGAFDSSLNTISDPFKQLLPSLAEFDKAAADMNTGILTLTRSAESHGGTMAVTALRYDEQTGKMERLGGTMHTLESAISSTGEQTGTLSSAFIQQIAATYSLESSTQALVEKYLGAAAASEYAIQGANQVQYSVQSLGGALGQFAADAVAYGDRIRGAGLLVAGAGARALSLSRPQASYASGTNYVPYDMIAQIHKGEAVIPAAENARRLSSGGDDESKALQAATLGYMRKMSNQLRNFEYMGIPIRDTSNT